MISLDGVLKSRDITLPTKVCLLKAMVFPSSHEQMWKLDHKESQIIDAFELWCWRRLLRVLWTSRRSIQSTPKGNQPWTFIGRTDAEIEALIPWPPDVKSWLIGKDPDAGKEWRQEENGVIGDEMVGWHHWLNGHEFEQTQGDNEGQGGLACCSSWGHRESDTTKWLNNKPASQCLCRDPLVHCEEFLNSPLSLKKNNIRV